MWDQDFQCLTTKLKQLSLWASLTNKLLAKLRNRNQTFRKWEYKIQNFSGNFNFLGYYHLSPVQNIISLLLFFQCFLSSDTSFLWYPCKLPHLSLPLFIIYCFIHTFMIIFEKLLAKFPFSVYEIFFCFEKICMYYKSIIH